MAVSIADWPRYINQAYEHTKPGGWCEFKDWDFTPVSLDDSLPQDGIIKKLHDMVGDCCEKIGRQFSPGPMIKGWVEKAGYENVTEVILSVPVGLWPKEKHMKEIGAWNYLCLIEGLEAGTLRLLTSVYGMTVEEIYVMLTQMRKELKDKTVHFQYTYHVVYGQKPVAAAEA